jgi:hypothetical protein
MSETVTPEPIVLYEYTRNGVVYYTPNEIIATMRADDGKYYAIEYKQ